MPTSPDQSPHIDAGIVAAISGWITAGVGFLWTGGRHAQKFEALEEKMEKLEPVHETLATIKNDLEWIKSRLR